MGKGQGEDMGGTEVTTVVAAIKSAAGVSVASKHVCKSYFLQFITVCTIT